MVKKSAKPGRIRRKLALLLEEKIPGISVDPAELWTQHPEYIVHYGCCVWHGQGQLNGLTVSIYSWDTMTNCARFGITIEQDGPREYEIHHNGDIRKEKDK